METTTYPAGYDPNSATHNQVPSHQPPIMTQTQPSSADPSLHHLDTPITLQYVKGQDGEMYN